MRPLDIPGGGVAFQYKNRPTSVYLAYPGSDYQVEVYDPHAGRAGKLLLRLVNFVAPLEEAGAPVTAAPDVPAAPKS